MRKAMDRHVPSISEPTHSNCIWQIDNLTVLIHPILFSCNIPGGLKWRLTCLKSSPLSHSTYSFSFLIPILQGRQYDYAPHAPDGPPEYLSAYQALVMQFISTMSSCIVARVEYNIIVPHCIDSPTLQLPCVCSLITLQGGRPASIPPNTLTC